MPASKKKGQADAFDVEFGTRLKEIRKGKSLTQKDVANALGISSQQIQKYEKGQDRMSYSRVFELSKFLKVPIASFIPEEHTTPSEITNATIISDRANDVLSSKEQEKIIEVFATITDPQRRKKVIDLLETMRADS